MDRENSDTALHRRPLDDDMPVESWDNMIGINYSGMLHIGRTGANIMRDHGHGGSVINTASMSGHIINLTKNPDVSMIAYTSTKAAVLHLTRALAAAYVNSGIRFNSVSPGYIYSGVHDPIPQSHLDWVATTIPMQRFGTLDEIVGIVAFLASDLASYMTGSDVLVDGGYCIT
jgi:NAD(P)-dependent dehydrogenase (short-subunit alcohol dehydrogenase family)